MKIFLLSVPYDSGHHRKRMGTGPEVLAESMRTQLVEAGHSVRSNEVSIQSDFPTEVTACFQVCRAISEQIRSAVSRSEFPVILAGNCSTSIGTLAGLSGNHGVVWFDCHADFNTPETTIGGFLDGMALAIVTGYCWKQLASSVNGFVPVPEANVVLAGTRDFDDLELKKLSSSGVNLITASMVRENPENIEACFPNLESVYLHIDLDVLDPGVAKVNSYSREGGLTTGELVSLVDRVKRKYRIAAVAFTAYDPSLDAEARVPAIVNDVLRRIVD